MMLILNGDRNEHLGRLESSRSGGVTHSVGPGGPSERRSGGVDIPLGHRPARLVSPDVLSVFSARRIGDFRDLVTESRAIPRMCAEDSGRPRPAAGPRAGSRAQFIMIIILLVPAAVFGIASGEESAAG